MVDLSLNESLLHIPDSRDDKPYLIGSRCRVCGYVCFPKKLVCVRCRRDNTMNEIKLGPYGTLENYAVMQVGTPDFPPPYIMGYVRTREDALVFTLITGCEARDGVLTIGEEMELVVEKIREDRSGNNLLGWKFKPIEKGTAL